MGRAVVLDQHIIDKLLTKKKITPNQHLVADKYYHLISTSGAFISSPPFERVSISVNNKSKPLQYKEFLEPNALLKKRVCCGLLWLIILVR